MPSKLLCSVSTVIAASLALPALAGAATINVTTTKDEFGGGGTSKCALREAIQAANTNSKFGGCDKGSGKDTVKLGAGRYKLKIVGTGEDLNADGDLDVDGPLTISGKSRDKSVIDANGSITLERAIHQLGGSLTVSGVTVRGGHDATNSGGGGVYNDDGALTVKNARIAHNLSGAYSGGGIRSDSGDVPVKVISSQILENDTYYYGGGISSEGGGDLIVQQSLIAGNSGDAGPGGIHAQQAGAFKLIRSTVTENTGTEYGGGIEIDGGSTLIQDSTISNNHIAEYGYYGAGIYDEGNEGVAKIIRSTISGNSVNGSGAGLYLQYETWQIQNSTISRNSAGYDYGYGGGIYNTGATVKLNGVTVSQNFGDNGYAGIENSSGTMEFRNSIIADNRDYYYSTDYDCSGATSLGHNLIGDGSCSPLGSDVIGPSGDAPLDALILPLGSYGGPTRTHALMAGSPALNKANNCLSTDQRGHKRKKSKCDIGAYER